jgi:hypothetical protein
MGCTAPVGSAERVVSLIDHQLRTAIARRRLLQFTYRSVTRVAEPHDYGVQRGARRLLIYQIRSTPFSRGWRLLDVDKIENLVVLERTFAGTRRQADQDHYRWDEVFARVE